MGARDMVSPRATVRRWARSRAVARLIELHRAEFLDLLEEETRDAEADFALVRGRAPTLLEPRP